MTKREKNKLRSKRKKQQRKQEELDRWVNCCHDKLIPWDCYCSFGCDCCDIHMECGECHTKYRDKDIDKFEFNLHGIHLLTSPTGKIFKLRGFGNGKSPSEMKESKSLN